ncbi:MAG TPA: DUF1566 domain-containing protein [Candidatus Margulisiibacteriota bacterium]|nr:DUF1566 domain-containing protein [Candidatus Margulisiibacteriota bacterium]
MTKASVTIAACTALLWAGTALAAATPQQKCEVAKLKAQGALQTCLTKNSGNVILGKSDASAACQATFTKALETADKKAPCRYVDNGDGTVSDLNTGLMWEQKDNLDGTVNTSDPHDADNVYTWCVPQGMYFCAAVPDPPDGTAFVTFLGALNGGTSSDGSSITGCFAGYCDWRLPTIVELQGIVDPSATGCASGSPCIDPAFGPTQSNFYWSATIYPGLTSAGGFPISAWIVLPNGTVGKEYKAIPLPVRAVRGGL